MEVEMMPMWMRFALWAVTLACLVAVGVCGDLAMPLTAKALKVAAAFAAVMSFIDIIVAFFCGEFF